MEMKTEYRRDLQHSWMILSGGQVPGEDAYPVRMLTENRIEGLLPCRTVILDGEPRFYYDISSRQPLAVLWEAEPVSRSFLERLLTALIHVLEQMEDYLLDPDGLLLSPQYLYSGPEQNRFCFCWYPGSGSGFHEQIKILGAALLPRLDQADRAGVVTGYRFYQYCEAEGVTKDRLRELLYSRPAQQETRQPTKEEIERAAVMDSFFDEPDEEVSVVSSFGGRFKNWFRRKRKRKDDPYGAEGGAFPANSYSAEGGAFPADPYGAEGETLPADPYGTENETPPADPYGGEGKIPGAVKNDRQPGESAETTLLTPDMLFSGQSRPRWILRILEDAGEERIVSLSEDLYFVGKEETGASLPFSSPAVSRLHAKLQREGETWSLTDLNSRNGTFRLQKDGLSGEQREILLQPEEAVLLQDGDEIRFADVHCRIKKGDCGSTRHDIY